jgi:hypothetical protein
MKKAASIPEAAFHYYFILINFFYQLKLTPPLTINGIAL